MPSSNVAARGLANGRKRNANFCAPQCHICFKCARHFCSGEQSTKISRGGDRSFSRAGSGSTIVLLMEVVAELLVTCLS